MTRRIKQVIRDIQQLIDFYKKTETLRHRINIKSKQNSPSIPEKNVESVRVKERPERKRNQEE